jgi:uncharacterized protein (DUF362 family)
MHQPRVSVCRVIHAKDLRESVWAAVERAMVLAGWMDSIPRGANVALKPNLGWDLFLPGAVTSPWVVEGVIRTIRPHVGELFLVESDQVVVDVNKAFAQSGLDRVCRAYDVRWVNMTHLPLVEVEVPQPRALPKIAVPEILLRTVLVTIPVMKTHNKTTITGALKNQWGCLPMFRHQYHLVLDAALADINQVVRPQFAVMDATVALEGNSPKSGIPRIVDRVLASSDPVALDSVAAYLMGFAPSQIGHLQECAAVGLGQATLDEIEMLGDPAEPLSPPFIPARHNLVSRMELVLRRNARLRPWFFDTPLFRVCCALTLLYYDVWYHVLGIGRRRRDAVLRSAYGAQWQLR